MKSTIFLWKKQQKNNQPQCNAQKSYGTNKNEVIILLEGYAWKAMEKFPYKIAIINQSSLRHCTKTDNFPSNTSRPPQDRKNANFYFQVLMKIKLKYDILLISGMEKCDNKVKKNQIY